jgi:signal transduction histidine kinase
MDGGALLGALTIFALGAVWGDRKKVRDAYEEQLELRAAEKERERIEAARRAVGEERLRIARELHDVVAHALSVVAVQSGVGAHVIDNRPDEAKRILETISHTSRDSLDEMRRLLGVLRAAPTGPDGDHAGGDLLGGGRLGGDQLGVDQLGGDTAPAPGLAALDGLVERVTAAGVPIETHVEGVGAALPTGVDLAAYRIVQEALTNVLKHAGRAKAHVVVRHLPGAVQVEVVDDGRGAASHARAPNASGDDAGSGSVNGPANGSVNGSGHGLVGMRERAALYGGALEAGPRPGGGFRVATTLRYATP